MYPSTFPCALPIPPRDILERYAVHEPTDTRFQSCARLLQSIWRERAGFEPGQYARPGGEVLTLGSRLTVQAGRAGFNYADVETAKLVRRELAYRERGALIDEARIWENLLSSSALVFNLFAPLKMDFEAAKRVLNAVLPINIKAVTSVQFETSPGRGDDRYIGDHTALDLVITYTAHDGASSFLGIEVKYAEGFPGSATPVKPRLLEVAASSGLYKDPLSESLHRTPLRQFFAEHSLCYAMVAERKDFDRGRFVLVAPTMNYEIEAVARAYRSHLVDAANAIIPHDVISLERLVGALADNGLGTTARALDRRYLDFAPVFDLIDEWEPHSELGRL